MTDKVIMKSIMMTIPMEHYMELLRRKKHIGIPVSESVRRAISKYLEEETIVEAESPRG